MKMSKRREKLMIRNTIVLALELTAEALVRFNDGDFDKAAGLLDSVAMEAGSVRDNLINAGAVMAEDI